MPYGIGFWEIILVAVILFIYSVPAFVIATRRNVPYPGVAFIPFFGQWIALLRSVGQRAWWVLVVLTYIGLLLLPIYLAIELPKKHLRTRWWTLALLVPLVGVIAAWVYAFTLQHSAVPWDWASRDTASQSQPSLVEQIAQLAEQRDGGSLSDEEFDAKKAELIARV